MMLIKIVLLIVGIHIASGKHGINLDKNLWKTWKNSTFYAFRGIKYAKSPTGELRFKVSANFFHVFMLEIMQFQINNSSY